MSNLESDLRNVRLQVAEEFASRKAAALPLLSRLSLEEAMARRQWGGLLTESQNGWHRRVQRTWDLSFRPEADSVAAQMGAAAIQAGHRVIVQGYATIVSLAEYAWNGPQPVLTRDRRQVEALQEWSGTSGVSLRVAIGTGADEEVWLYRWGHLYGGDPLGCSPPGHLTVTLRSREPLPLGRGQTKTATALARRWAAEHPAVTATVQVEVWTRAGRGGWKSKPRTLTYEAVSGFLRTKSGRGRDEDVRH